MKKKRKILVCVFLLFAIVAVCYLGFCFIYKRVVYNSFFEKAENFMQARQSGDKTYEGYLVSVWVTDSVLSTRGNLSVTQTRYLMEDEEGNDFISNSTTDLLIFPKVFGGYRIRVIISPGNGKRGTGFYIDESLNLLDDSPENRLIYEEYYSEIEKSVEIVRDVFGILK